LSRSEYLDGLAAVGFADAEVTFRYEAAPGMHGAIIRASKPADCCPPAERESCCDVSATEACCASGKHAPGTCGCR
jgi:hypothetical protein